jgi:prolipoprotein diacylglyceryltransferase
MLYTLGRIVIETMRTDTANHILGLRLNVWTSAVVFAGSAYAYWRLGVRGRDADTDVGKISGEPETTADDPSPSQHLD